MKITKKMVKESEEFVHKIWDVVAAKNKGKEVQGHTEIECIMTLINMDGQTVIDRVKYVRYDGMIFTENREFICNELTPIIGIQF